MAWTLERVSVSGGEYRGLLQGKGTPPEVRAVLDGAVVPHLEVTPVEGVAEQWMLRCPVPAEMISDRLRVLSFEAEDMVLDTLAVAAGGLLDHDAQAQIETLRAELELVKTALRRIASRG